MTAIDAVHSLTTRFLDWTHDRFHAAHDRLDGPCRIPECPICGTGEPVCRRCWDR
jgi:hypothetical protein